MSIAGEWYGCLFRTLWMRNLHEKRNCKNHSKKFWYFHRFKMICSVYNERWNKSTMKHSTKLFNWWLSFIIFLKRITGKYYNLMCKQCKCNCTNERTYYNNQELHWLMLQQPNSTSLMFEWFSFHKWLILKC